MFRLAQKTRSGEKFARTHMQRMKVFRIAAGVALALGCLGLSRMCGLAQGTTIWNGPLMIFTEAAGADGSQPADQDRITSDVWITRNITQGLINAAQETGYTHALSPVNTLWAYGSLNNYASLTYASWEGWFGGRPGGGPRSTLGRPAVLYLPQDNIYLSVEFLSWGGSSGGFSYQRSTPSVPEPSAILMGIPALLAVRTIRVRRGDRSWLCRRPADASGTR